MLRLRSEGRFALLTAPLSMTEREMDGGGLMNLGRWTAEGGCPHMNWGASFGAGFSWGVLCLIPRPGVSYRIEVILSG